MAAPSPHQSSTLSDLVPIDAPSAKPALVLRCLAYLDRHLAVVFLLPGALLLLLIILYPIVSNFALSVTNAHLLYPGIRFIGLANFRSVLGDPDFWAALLHSFVWTTGSVGIQLLLGLIAALLVDQSIRVRGVFRTLMIIPYTFPAITMALLWRWILNSLNGILDHYLMALGIIGQPVGWLVGKATAMLSVIGINVWFGYPLMMLAILAGLQSIPRDFYEVAQIEGASYPQTLRYVILPSIWRIIGIMVVLRTIWVFNNFDFIFLLTGGGPVNATETLPLYAFRMGWRVYNIGKSGAIGVLLFLIVGTLAFFYFRALRVEAESR